MEATPHHRMGQEYGPISLGCTTTKQPNRSTAGGNRPNSRWIPSGILNKTRTGEGLPWRSWKKILAGQQYTPISSTSTEMLWRDRHQQAWLQKSIRRQVSTQSSGWHIRAETNATTQKTGARYSNFVPITAGLHHRIAESTRGHGILTIRCPLQTLHGGNIQPWYCSLQCNDGRYTNDDGLFTATMAWRTKCNAGKDTQ